jgi:hypothetical protein
MNPAQMSSTRFLEGKPQQIHNYIQKKFGAAGVEVIVQDKAERYDEQSKILHTKVGAARGTLRGHTGPGSRGAEGAH